MSAPSAGGGEAGAGSPLASLKPERTTLTAGSFYCNPKGNVHGPAIAHEETVVIEVYDGPHYPVKPDWYTDEQDAR